ncbi:hypothetical protein D1839_19270 [Roseburia sp. 1XD42-34]|nr:hypothetical protein [Roseburia sp. 1XD42-34]RKI74200.1 hypothetical protein D7V87_19255 [Clostridium sp. 1xD42-85]
MANTENDVNAGDVSFALNVNGGAAIPVSVVTVSPFVAIDLGRQPGTNRVLLQLAAGDLLTLIVISATANQLFRGPNASSITLIKVAN